MKKIDCVYFSPTGNSKKIANAVAKELGSQINEIDITLAASRNGNHIFSSDNTVVVGVPVYGGRIPRLIEGTLKNFNGNGAKAIALVTYGNRAYEDALLELTDLLDSQGFLVIAAGAFIGEHSSTTLLATNRPNEDDLQIARDFGIQVSKYSGDKKVQVPGNFPYVQKESLLPPLSPVTDETCVQCKLCAKTCPTSAIDFEDCKIATSEKCIKCCSCIKKCPQNSKAFIHPGFIKMQETLVANFAIQYKEPELFFSVDI